MPTELAEPAEPMPPACPAASTPPAGGRRDPSERQIIAEAARLAQRAHHSWGLALPPHPRGAVQSQPVQTLHQLRATADQALAELRRRAGPVDPEIRDDLLRALELELHLSRHILTRRSARRAALRRGLERLRPVADPAHLLDRACVEALRSCGVRRAMLSRVSDGVWSPWRSADTTVPAGETGSAGRDGSAGRSSSAGTALSAGTGTTAAWQELGPMPIERLPLEAEVAAERRPVLVERPASDPRVHPALRRLLTSSFVVAPIAPADTVIGLLHLDRSGEAREVDRDDLEVAWAFAEGFGRVYERAVHRQRLDTQRRLVQRAAQRQDLDTAPPDHAIDLLPIAPRAPGRYEPDTASPPVDAPEESPGILTSREREVADLMCTGLPNEQIGERLVISPATVKSHVRAILRKLGAANRSHAIAIHLRHTHNPA
ncbi:helix-turn-helix transcriptional regulator [Protofrankia coriariae]|uniref:HTH luxR-type domain-containing protein n=1 Tax=Protofrankia coriariae TaxID=1562887 RepID=A0ABR5F722_9ACTN|nr:LuxR C-terminal-related transcriptional regulator [Protofrankia coriariae]KLL12531.1 hypothetical protein FrCorBMG51_04560 [Protofrankia coriariae]ONH35456.1 hypothetical protein BL254_10880 [Protofrankia sp. BMG5.30]